MKVSLKQMISNRMMTEVRLSSVGNGFTRRAERSCMAIVSSYHETFFFEKKKLY